jgi:hypothetical protein
VLPALDVRGGCGGGDDALVRVILDQGSELRPHPFRQKRSTPTLLKIILQSRKSTKIGKKLIKARKIAKSSLKHFKTTLKGFFERFFEYLVTF